VQQQTSRLLQETETQSASRLELVVPFTSPRLTRAALDAANNLSSGLNAAIRLIKIQVVPYPLDLTRPPVVMEFLTEQLRCLLSKRGTRREICLARTFQEGLKSATSEFSVIVLASLKRPWRTHTEQLADRLRKSGHTVVLVC
jgi:hypothetical protein